MAKTGVMWPMWYAEYSVLGFNDFGWVTLTICNFAPVNTNGFFTRNV